MLLYLAVEVVLAVEAVTNSMAEALTSPDPSTTSLHQTPLLQDSPHGVPRA